MSPDTWPVRPSPRALEAAVEQPGDVLLRHEAALGHQVGGLLLPRDRLVPAHRKLRLVQGGDDPLAVLLRHALVLDVVRVDPLIGVLPRPDQAAGPQRDEVADGRGLRLVVQHLVGCPQDGEQVHHIGGHSAGAVLGVLAEVLGQRRLTQRGHIDLLGLQRGQELGAGQGDQLDIAVLQTGLLQGPQHDDALRLPLGEADLLAAEVLHRLDAGAGGGREDIGRVVAHLYRDDLRSDADGLGLDRRYSGVGCQVDGMRPESLDDVGAGAQIRPLRHSEREILLQTGRPQLKVCGAYGDRQFGAGRRGTGGKLSGRLRTGDCLCLRRAGGEAQNRPARKGEERPAADCMAYIVAWHGEFPISGHEKSLEVPRGRVRQRVVIGGFRGCGTYRCGRGAGCAPRRAMSPRPVR